MKRDGKFKIGLCNQKVSLKCRGLFTSKACATKILEKPCYRGRNRCSVGWRPDGFRNISKYSQNYQYILVLQDVFSRFIFTAPLKNKTASEVISGLKSVMKQGRQGKLLRTDNGKEFKNRFVVAFLKEKGIHQIFTENETKRKISQNAVFRTCKTDFLACLCSINHTSILNNCLILRRLSTTRHPLTTPR